MSGRGSGHLSLDVMTSSPRSLASNSVLISGERDAILIDTAFTLPDTRKIVEQVKASGKQLKAVLVSHAHPDHYFGIDLVSEAFPGVEVLARHSVIEQISEYRAKIIHWQEMYGADELPSSLRLPDRLEGDSYSIEGQAINLIDLYMIESLHATAFYLPAEKTLIAEDFVYSECHLYMADVGDPDTWIAELKRVRDAFEIERVIPGHGPPGGPEQIGECIRWLQAWKEVAQPGVGVAEIARQMADRYPKYELGILLWLTRGPGFGLSGAGELGVPPELLGG
jgi:glyoxylase-like metal-dependent hydrolase (beta-lactamase superfamily II)